MQILIREDYDEMTRVAAQIVADLIRNKPNCVLGLATGGTPERMYAELVRMHEDEKLDFSQVISFNLDEYVGLGAAHDQSYHFFMQNQLVKHVNIDPHNTHIPDGMAGDLDAECARYEKMIRDAGGIDLQVLGIGGNGHLAFNEPAISSFAGKTRVVTLSDETRQANSRFFRSIESVPRRAISMGLATILEQCHRCILLASGVAKAKAVLQAIEGPITTMVPASVLQLHPDVTYVLDEDAAALLELKDYYRDIEASALAAVAS